MAVSKSIWLGALAGYKSSGFSGSKKSWIGRSRGTGRALGARGGGWSSGDRRGLGLVTSRGFRI